MVPAVDSNHIVHVGGLRVLAPEDWGLYYLIAYDWIKGALSLLITLFVGFSIYLSKHSIG